MRELVEKAKQGDIEAFGHLVERLQDAVYGTAYAMLGNFHDAQDAAQEAFIQAWRELKHLNDPDRFPGWLCRIARNRSIDLLRRTHARTQPLEDAGRTATAANRDDPAACVERTEMRDAVLDAIHSLSEPNRLATTLFYINGYSVDEVAGFLDVPVGTVKRRLHDSRQQLKERMIGMVEQQLQDHRPSVAFREAVLKRIAHWERFKGSDEEKAAMVESDPEWRRLLEREMELEPVSEACRSIREQIAHMEPCHEHYVENAEHILHMVGSMTPERILDCQQASDGRREEAASYANALQAWIDGRAAESDGPRAAEIAGILGKRAPEKVRLVEHLLCKLKNNSYSVYSDEDEDFERVESRIQHLEICNHNWRENLRIVLREIAAGKRLFPWHTPDGYKAHGDCPDRVADLAETMSAAAAWASGDTAKAGKWAEVLGEPTAEKRWLVACLCKHVASQHQRHDAAGALAMPDI